MSEKEVQVIERIRNILGEKWIPEQVIFEVEREIDQYYTEHRYADIVRACTACGLHAGCKQKVPGVGPIPSDIMFVGESPGELEDEQGVPFIGPSGQLLHKIVSSVGWKSEEIYMTNVLKCRPPGNRNPTKAEAMACYRHLLKEIEMVKPKVIVCWGSVAANVLIHPDFKITHEHGVWFEHHGARIIACFHPAYIMRLGPGTQQEHDAKVKVWHAIKKIKAYQDADYTDSLVEH
jgi:uracil-DNA glycosylase family 4